jgi:3-oxoacyl-[acyl-carrier protein] reductase
MATALELLQDERIVVLADKDLPDLNEIPASLRHKAFSIELDVADQSACIQAVNRIHQQHGGIDILVNNAGISLKNSSGKCNGILETNIAEVQRMLEVNTLAVVHLCQLVLPHMKSNRWGRIVNVSSLAARGKSIVAGPAYILSKAAILGFSRSVAAEMGPYGITSNCVAPGRILTEMAREAGEEVNRDYATKIPARRLGEPVDIGAAISYLCSEKAGYTNGSVIDVNGGFFMC